MKFQIVDAFTDKIFGGNPAGVVLLPEGADFPADETMRQTAAELRYSETAFVKPLGGSHFQIRYFTPAAEVELCGHATIGSFHALRGMGLVADGNSYINETLSGTLEIVVGKNAILMDMAKPQAFESLDTGAAGGAVSGHGPVPQGAGYRGQKGRAVLAAPEGLHRPDRHHDARGQRGGAGEDRPRLPGPDRAVPQV